jgi:hypothetical protein
VYIIDIFNLNIQLSSSRKVNMHNYQIEKEYIPRLEGVINKIIMDIIFTRGTHY